MRDRDGTVIRVGQRVQFVDREARPQRTSIIGLLHGRTARVQRVSGYYPEIQFENPTGLEHYAGLRGSHVSVLPGQLRVLDAD